MTTCLVCLEEKKFFIECCDKHCCISCTERYLLQLKDTPRCMFCKTHWDRHFLAKKLRNGFLKKEYRKVEEELFITREKLLLPRYQTWLKIQDLEEEKKEEISADAPADLSENPPAPPKPDTPKPHEHPAIKAFREVTARYPPKELFADVIKACGDVPDLDRMRKCWLAWLKVSGNRANTTWVLDWYANGHSGNPDKSRANGARASPQTAEAPKSRIGKGMNW